MRKQHSQSYTNYIQSKQWAVKSKWVRELTGGRCCFFPWLKAQETHHLTYNVRFGREIPCWHLIPLSRKAHRIVHIPFLWQQPIKLFVNIYLRLIFLLLWTIANPWIAIPTWLLLYSSFSLVKLQITKQNLEQILETVPRSIAK